MKFFALDVETANSDLASICQIGVAQFEGGKIVGEWDTLIDPEDEFDPINVSIHGIDENAVMGAPKFSEIIDTLCDQLKNSIVVTHTHFDRAAISQASSKSQIEPPKCNWLDSARVARRSWKECAKSGYGLAAVAELIGYSFKHHNALEDAKAAGQILLAAMNETGLSIEEWLQRVAQPIDLDAANAYSKAQSQTGNPDGPLFGETIVFTGALQIKRNEAAEIAARMGCNVARSVTKKTTLVCVGDNDIRNLAGHDKSRKHRDAISLIEGGHPIRIIQETDFMAMMGLE